MLRNVTIAAGLAFLLSGAATTSGEEIKIVFPNAFENVEGDDGDPATGVWRNGYRYQAILDSGQFISVPDTHHLMIGFRLRPDGRLVESPLSGTIPHLTLRLSTTSKNPGELSFRFADNVEPDETLVYDGSITCSSENTGPPGGPKEFDYGVDFQTPFSYDPSQGNLLIDFIAHGPADNLFMDANSTGNPTGFVYAEDANAASAMNYRGDRAWIYQFVFDPVLQAGDANRDFEFDQLDLIQVQQAGKYLTGQPATWGEGDWNGAPGGYTEAPPAGDGLFDQRDIVAALQTGMYLAGPYGGHQPKSELVDIAPVPQPSGILLLFIGGIILAACRAALGVVPKAMFVVASILVAGVGGHALGYEVKIVAPNAMENVEGSTHGIDMDLGAARIGFRVQYIYPSTEFDALPDTHRWITAIAFRPDASVTEPRTVTWPDTQWFLSTTTTSADDMSTVFSENHGDNLTEVYNGTFTLTTQATGPPEGPREFDYRFDLQTPFLYDRKHENLVVDFIGPFGYSPAFLDDEDSGTRSWLGYSGSAPLPSLTTGNLQNYQLILEFTFVPEPSTFTLAALGLVSLVACRRNRIARLGARVLAASVIVSRGEPPHETGSCRWPARDSAEPDSAASERYGQHNVN